jgi:hypothetical protein
MVQQTDGYVNIASECDAASKRHASPRIYRSAFDASINPQQGTSRGASCYRTFRQIRAGSDAEQDSEQDAWIEFQVADGEYDQIERTLQQDDVLAGYVDEKIR